MKRNLIYVSVLLSLSFQIANAYAIKHSGGFSFEDILELVGAGLGLGGIIYFIGGVIKIKIIQDLGMMILRFSGGAIGIFIVIMMLGFLIDIF